MKASLRRTMHIRKLILCIPIKGAVLIDFRHTTLSTLELAARMHIENKKNARRREREQKRTLLNRSWNFADFASGDGMKAASRQRSASNAKRPPDGLPPPYAKPHF